MSRRALIERATAAATLAAQALDPRSHGPRDVDANADAALFLFRQAVAWSLSALDGVQATPQRQWEAADPDLLAALAGGAPARETLRQILFSRPEGGPMALQATPAGLEVLQRFVPDLLAHVQATQSQGRARTWFQPGTAVRRWAAPAALLLICLVLGAGALGAAFQGPDLALGKHWVASSRIEDCPLGISRRCVEQEVDVFFHTENEIQPWVSVDLEQAEWISRVAVWNRTDCCQWRAAPLVLEASMDGQDWTPIATRTRSFRNLDFTFLPITARFLKLSSPRKTALHLQRVSVYR